jgi:hypothetical protein
VLDDPDLSEDSRAVVENDLASIGSGETCT